MRDANLTHYNVRCMQWMNPGHDLWAVPGTPWGVGTG